MSREEVPSGGVGAERRKETRAVSWRRAAWSSVRRSAEDISRQPRLVLGLAILFGYVGVAVAAWVHYGSSLATLPLDINTASGFVQPAPPTLTFSPGASPLLSLGAWPLGQTGFFGFNVATALVKATPWDLLLFGGILLPTAFLGLLVGVVAGGVGGIVEDALMTIADVLLSIPTFIVALLLFVIVLPNLKGDAVVEVFCLAMVVVSWPAYARLVRAKARLVSRQAFVEASRASGARRGRILLRHVLPNSVAPMFSQIPITLSNLLALMVVLPYAGILSSEGGILQIVIFTPSTTFPEWTWILVNGLLGWSPIPADDSWWGFVYPAIWIMVFALGVILVCDGCESYLSRRD